MQTRRALCASLEVSHSAHLLAGEDEVHRVRRCRQHRGSSRPRRARADALLLLPYDFHPKLNSQGRGQGRAGISAPVGGGEREDEGGAKGGDASGYQWFPAGRRVNPSVRSPESHALQGRALNISSAMHSCARRYWLRMR